jgi:hypothetical protein
MADVTIDLEDDEDSSIDEDTERTLAKHSPSVEDVHGNENEQSQANTKTNDIVNGQRPSIVMNHGAEATAKDVGESEYDSGQSQTNTKLHKPSQQQTSFDPSDGDHSTVNWTRLYKKHHSTTDDETHTMDLQRRQDRQADIDIVTELFDLTVHEREVMDIVQKQTNLRNHGSPSYEHLICATLRYIFRANRDFALKESSFRTHDKYGKVYTELLTTWNCDSNVVDELYDDHVNETYDIFDDW